MNPSRGKTCHSQVLEALEVQEYIVAQREAKSASGALPGRGQSSADLRLKRQMEREQVGRKAVKLERSVKPVAPTEEVGMFALLI